MYLNKPYDESNNDQNILHFVWKKPSENLGFTIFGDLNSIWLMLRGSLVGFPSL